MQIIDWGTWGRMFLRKLSVWLRTVNFSMVQEWPNFLESETLHLKPWSILKQILYLCVVLESLFLEVLPLSSHTLLFIIGVKASNIKVVLQEARWIRVRPAFVCKNRVLWVLLFHEGTLMEAQKSCLLAPGLGQVQDSSRWNVWLHFRCRLRTASQEDLADLVLNMECLGSFTIFAGNKFVRQCASDW